MSEREGDARVGAPALTREAALAIVGVFTLSLAVSLVTPFCERDRVRDPATWVAFVRSHAALLRTGETLLVHPPWRDDVERALIDARVLPSARVTTAFAPRHGDPLPPLVIVREAGGVGLPHNLADTEELARSDGLVLERVTRSAHGGVHDFADDLARADVSVTFADRTVRCAWDGERHTCADLPEWVHVGEEDVIVNGARERCIWAHPITGGVLHVRFPDDALAALPENSALDLAVALSDTAADNKSGAVVDISLRANDTELTHVARKGTRGFTHVSAAAPANGLELQVTTPSDGQRHTCFRLTTRGAP